MLCGDRLMWSVPRLLAPVGLDLFEAISNAAALAKPCPYGAAPAAAV